MGNKQQQPPLRRLLKHLQKRIGARTVEIIDGIDNRKPPTSLAGRRAEKRHRAADIIHRYLIAQHAPFVDGPLDNQKIRLRLRGDAPGYSRCGIDIERDRVLHVPRAGIGMAENEARYAASKAASAAA